MNEFDLQLESGLRRYLDPISAAPVPPRRGKRFKESLRVDLRVVTPERLAVVPIKAY
ncbi:MAG: hypothetical protein ABI959_04105 [Candidatus Dormiibacterota bacterium]